MQTTTQVQFDGSALAHRWDRVATLGHKVQEGEEFDFTSETLSQMVQNFSRCYQGRRLGLDFEHKALLGPVNLTPVENLAYYNGLCVITKAGVIAFTCQDPRVKPPDPEMLYRQIVAKYPSDPDPYGLWAYRCEVTELGKRVLPNCEQLSPLFSKNATDEQGHEIGYAFANLSAVSVAFQDRTVLNLSKFPLKKENVMGTQNNQTPQSPAQPLGMDPNEEKALSEAELVQKLGLSDNPKAEDLATAMMSYLSDTDDSREIRQQMAKAFAACQKRLSKMSDDVAQDAVPPKTAAAAPLPDAGAMGMPDSVAHTNEADKPSTPAGMKQTPMSLMVTSLSQQLAKTNEVVFAMQKEKREHERQTEAETFALSAIAEGRYEALGKERLIALYKKDPQGTKALIGLIARGTFGLARTTLGGNPIGSSSAVVGSSLAAAWSQTRDGTLVKGSQLSALSKVLAGKENISLGEAQKRVLRDNPHLYH